MNKDIEALQDQPIIYDVMKKCSYEPPAPPMPDDSGIEPEAWESNWRAQAWRRWLPGDTLDVSGVTNYEPPLDLEFFVRDGAIVDPDMVQEGD